METEALNKLNIENRNTSQDDEACLDKQKKHVFVVSTLCHEKVCAKVGKFQNPRLFLYKLRYLLV